MAFKIEIRQDNRVISFAPRTVGQSGRDILAIKVALGLVSNVNSLGGPIQVNKDTESGRIPLDAFDWFNCRSGQGSTLSDAELFDLTLQS